MWSMKKASGSDYEVYRSTRFDELEKIIKHKLPFPFDKEMINLLKEENQNWQEYIYLERGNDYAFFILYQLKMNLFTFGKANFKMNFHVVGYPCSIGECGYYTNNIQMMLDYIKKIKGCKLVLNAKSVVKDKDITVGETLPSCIFKNDFETTDEYIHSLRSNYRRRINKAISRCKNIKVKTITDGSIDVYPLYLNTYNRSEYKLEKLEKGFFKKIDATTLIFLNGERPVGFVMLKHTGNHLIFMFCGMDYTYHPVDLYYYMLYTIIDYAIRHKCGWIDFGQTSEETKLKLGAYLEKRYFYAHHSNKFLNLVAKMGKELLEYKNNFPNYHPYKEKR